MLTAVLYVLCQFVSINIALINMMGAPDADFFDWSY